MPSCCASRSPGQAILLGLGIAHGVMSGHQAPAVRVGLHHGPRPLSGRATPSGDRQPRGTRIRAGKWAARCCSPGTPPRSHLNSRASSMSLAVARRYTTSTNRVEIFAAIRQSESARSHFPSIQCVAGRRSEPRRRAAPTRRHRLLLLYPRLRGRVRPRAGPLREVSQPARAASEFALAPAGSWRSTRLSSTALVATMIELSDISSADHSGRSMMPNAG